MCSGLHVRIRCNAPRIPHLQLTLSLVHLAFYIIRRVRQFRKQVCPENWRIACEFHWLLRSFRTESGFSTIEFLSCSLNPLAKKSPAFVEANPCIRPFVTRTLKLVLGGYTPFSWDNCDRRNRTMGRTGTVPHRNQVKRFRTLILRF